MLTPKDKERLEEIAVYLDSGETAASNADAAFLRNLITRSSENSSGVGEEAAETLVARVRERFNPTRAFFDMGDGERQEVDWDSVIGQVLHYGALTQPNSTTPLSSEQVGEGERERIARLAFVAGGEYMRDSIGRTRFGSTFHAGGAALVRASTAYSKEAR